MPSDRETAFAVWLTGLPASGKSTVARALSAELSGRGIRAAVLESDAVRREIAPNAGYGEAGRDDFYATLAYLARLLVLHGVPVIVDATANRRTYRDRARAAIPRFLEVHVRCPLAVCKARDPKGIYRRGAEGTADNVPGVSASYEPPLAPEAVVDGERDDPAAAARRIVAALELKGFLPRDPGDATVKGSPL
ncbi:adenylyl-sulfate kinase [Candidatus Deferrimicrobium sp.]|uniref:adenylyl-sulfate kinase n=1 Tax=Candidatus Deferrimicrobium sp. TaxID=3060586 RepID=UPI003C40EB1F